MAINIHKKRRIILILSAIVICLFSPSMNAYAITWIHDSVIYEWDHMLITSHDSPPIEYDTNKKYRDLIYINGYTYTETSQKTSTWYQELFLGEYITHYTRTFQTY